MMREVKPADRPSIDVFGVEDDKLGGVVFRPIQLHDKPAIITICAPCSTGRECGFPHQALRMPDLPSLASLHNITFHNVAIGQVLPGAVVGHQIHIALPLPVVARVDNGKFTTTVVDLVPA